MCEKGLFAAIHYFGSQNALAKAMGVTQQTVSRWLNGERKMPDTNTLQLFVKTQGAIALHDLFPSSQSISQLLEKVNFFRTFPAVAIPVKAIHIEGCKCPKYTASDDLLREANDVFLARPLLIDAHHQLIACACRLRANTLLGRDTVLVHRVNLRDVIQGNFSLTPLIEALPISEKVAVGLAIERELGNRQGKRIDLQLVDTYPQVTRGIKTRMAAAILAGFDSDFVYRKAKVVIQQGLSTLVQAMDNKVCSVTQAEKIASLPKQQQDAALNTLIESAKKRKIGYDKNSHRKTGIISSRGFI